MVDLLLEVGPVLAGGFGPTPLTFMEIDAWARRTARDLQPWEAQILRRLSSEWCSQASISDAHDCRPPWRELALPSREEVASKIDSIL